MSDPADQNTNQPAANSEPKEPAVNNEPVKNPEAVLAKNQELLEELKKVRADLGSLKAEKDTLVQEKMQAEGNKEEQIKYWQTKAQEAQEGNKKIVGSFLDRTVKAAFNNAALSKGCKEKYLSVLYNQAKSDEGTWNRVLGAVNKENFEVDSSALAEVVEGFKANYDDSGFFNRPNVKVDDETPPSGNFQPAANNSHKSEDDLLSDLAKLYS